MLRLVLGLSIAIGLAGCAATTDTEVASFDDPYSDVPLFPGETEEMRILINKYAQVHGIPAELLHKVIQRESDYRPGARNGPYWGLMQILPATARQMGHDGPAEALLDAETNLIYAGRYLRGAYLVADGDLDAAVMWYARGYYYEARDNCLLIETGLLDREIARHCRA